MKAKLKVLYESGDRSIKEPGSIYIKLKRWSVGGYVYAIDYVLDYGKTDSRYDEDDGTVYFWDITKVLLNVFSDSDAIRQAVKKHEELMLKGEEE